MQTYLSAAAHGAHILLVLAALYFFLLSVSNVLWLRFSCRLPHITAGPVVSVLIPCRDEERNIARCLESLLAQSYGNYEIVVLDDHSADGTWRIIDSYAHRHPGLIRAVRGRPLPGQDWCGKPFALQQLSETARGEYLLFTDADTSHSAESVAWAVTNMEWHRADQLSGYVRQEMSTLGELVIVPTMYIMTAMVLPLWLIAPTRTPLLAFAVGQLIMFRRDAFQAIGGYTSVSDRISEDVCITQQKKRAGFRTVFLDIGSHVKCRMYDGYHASFAGISKNMYDFLKNRPLFFTATATAIAFFVLLPVALLPAHLFSGNPAARITLLSVVFFETGWALTLYDRGLKWWVPLLYPIVFLHLLYMAWKSYGRVTAGQGVLWKGRVLK